MVEPARKYEDCKYQICEKGKIICRISFPFKEVSENWCEHCIIGYINRKLCCDHICGLIHVVWKATPSSMTPQKSVSDSRRKKPIYLRSKPIVISQRTSDYSIKLRLVMCNLLHKKVNYLKCLACSIREAEKRGKLAEDIIEQKLERKLEESTIGRKELTLWEKGYILLTVIHKSEEIKGTYNRVIPTGFEITEMSFEMACDNIKKKFPQSKLNKEKTNKIKHWVNALFRRPHLYMEGICGKEQKTSFKAAYGNHIVILKITGSEKEDVLNQLLVVL